MSEQTVAPPYLREVSRFNLNNFVRFKLTDVGRRHLYITGWGGKLTPGYSSAEDAEGWCSWPLWEIAAAFGAIMGNGLPVPIETAVDLVPDEWSRKTDAEARDAASQHEQDNQANQRTA